MTNPPVLLVDDDEWMAGHSARVLEAAGYSTDVAPHAIGAIETIDVRRPSVIILDIFLSGPNGFTLLHELQSHTDLAGIPVIVCTNSADAISGEDLQAYGVRAVLDKTRMTPEELVAAVRKVLL